MVARSPSVAGFAPNERPRVAVASDGTLAAIHEPTRVSIVEIPSCSAFAELGMDETALACEVAWVGTPPRLLVLSRHAAHSTVHLVDPFGPRTIAEIRLESPMQLYAAVGSHALAIGTQGSIVLATGDKTLAAHQFPSRNVPLAAGAAGTQFLVAVPGAIEEWDPQSRMPKRRLKLARPSAITAVGGSERVVWMTAQHEPHRIDVIPLVNRGQPKFHELPEPITSVSSHPRSDLIACIGATSGRVWVIDLDGRVGLRMVGPEGIDRAEAVGIVLGRVAGVLAAQAKHPITVVTLDRPDGSADEPEERLPSSPPPSKRSSLYGDAEDDGHKEETPTAVTLSTPGAEPITAAPPRASPRAVLPQFGAPLPEPAPAPVPMPRAVSRPEPRRELGSLATEPPPMAATPRREIGTLQTQAPPFSGGDQRIRALAAWRDRVAVPRARTQEPVTSPWRETRASWRGELVMWCGIADRSVFPVETPVAALTQRYELAPQLEAVLGYLYGQHLLGKDGTAPSDIAALLDGVWDEALGRGDLAARGIATLRGSRLHLSEIVLRALDDHSPRTGTLVGTPGVVSLLGPCVIVSHGPLPIIAAGCLASIGGAILAGHADCDPQALAEEARPYGAAPMWRVRIEQLTGVPTDQPFILVADDDATADQLGVPRLT